MTLAVYYSHLLLAASSSLWHYIFFRSYIYLSIYVSIYLLLCLPLTDCLVLDHLIYKIVILEPSILLVFRIIMRFLKWFLVRFLKKKKKKYLIVTVCFQGSAMFTQSKQHHIEDSWSLYIPLRNQEKFCYWIQWGLKLPLFAEGQVVFLIIYGSSLWKIFH